MAKTDLTISACIVANDRVLLVFHAKLQKWLFPGGHAEKDETLDEAVLREVKEETGLKFEFLDWGEVPKSAGEIKKLAIPFHANVHSVGDHNHYCAYYFGTVDNTEFKGNHETEGMQWFSEAEVRDLENLPESIKVMALHCLKRAKK